MTQAQREIVLTRAAGRCERCGRRCAGQFHHRKPRGMGGARRDSSRHCPSRVVYLCYACHRWAESERTEAMAAGWLVSHWADPAEVPVATFLGSLVLLRVDGTAVPV